MNGFTKNGVVQLPNPHLRDANEDFLYHLGYSKSDDLASLFGHIKFVLCGGTQSRMAKLAGLLEDSLPGQSPGAAADNICASGRYFMYRVGPVLCVNHGIGAPSIGLMLIECIKLLHYAGARDVTFFRIGTSGGLGIEPGTTVISTGAVNGLLMPYYIEHVFGKEVYRPALFDSKVLSELRSVAESDDFKHEVKCGLTLAANDFYEGQGRLDGLFCEYEESDKFEFIKKLISMGVVNIEMEAVAFAAITHRANVKAAMVTTALLNRALGDQVSTSDTERHDFELRPCKLVIAYIRHKMGVK